MIGIYDINECSLLGYKERLDIYKEIGFKEVALYLDDKYNRAGENYEDIIFYARKIGLEVRQVHIDYKISNLICEEKDDYFVYLEDRLREACRLKIPYVIGHASMSDNPPKIEDKALRRFENLMSKFSESEVTLCLENVRSNYNLKRLLALNLKNVKMCFDLGHAHCYGDEKELFNELKEYIQTSHLHNNFGSDTHNILSNGEIDYPYFLKELTKIKNSSNVLECFPERGKTLTNEEFKAFVSDCYEDIKNY